MSRARPPLKLVEMFERHYVCPTCSMKARRCGMSLYEAQKDCVLQIQRER